MASKAPLIQKNSRLRFGFFLPDTGNDQEGFDFFDLIDYPDIPVQRDDIIYTVKTVDRIDILSYKFYGDPVLWWVIAVANDLELVPDDLTEGTKIRIPSPRFVLNELFKTKIKGFN